MSELMVLGKWEEAKRAIAACTSVDELKQIRDKAQALMAYAKQARESLEVQNNVAEIKIRCERRIGEFSKDLPKAQGKRSDITSIHNDNKLTKISILKTAGIKNPQRYESIANLPEEEFEAHIQEVKKSNEELTTMGLIRLAKTHERDEEINITKEKINNLKPENGKYDVVILDPPWAYGREYDPNNSRIASPYPEQSQEEIYETCKSFFKDDCVLWLWTTHQFIWDAKKLVDLWGFEYKATLVWDKEHMGMGSWLRMQCEFCLLAVKGKPFFQNTTERDLINERKREHSRKPERFYNLVKKVCAGSIFEYYSREFKEGIITSGVEDGKMGR